MLRRHATNTTTITVESIDGCRDPLNPRLTWLSIKIRDISNGKGRFGGSQINLHHFFLLLSIQLFIGNCGDGETGFLFEVIGMYII
jgi:hypothetical protein